MRTFGCWLQCGESVVERVPTEKILQPLFRENIFFVELQTITHSQWHCVVHNKKINICAISLIINLLLIANLTFGQEEKEEKMIPINISYFGETFAHPGVQAGYENNFFRKFIFTASMGTRIHQRNHAGFFLSSGVDWRHTFGFGYSMEFGLGLGYLHTWVHGGKIYVVDDGGKVSSKSNYGRSHFMPSIKIGLIGWDFRQKTNLPLRLNADIIAFGRYPFNNYMLPHVAIKLGGTYYFSIK